MLLMTPTEAALLIGAKCGGASPDADDPLLVKVIGYITSRVEAALNVETLALADSVDSFELLDMPLYESNKRERVAMLRLSNGFVARDTVFVIDADSNEIDPVYYSRVDNDKGIVYLTNWKKGRYTVEYLSGFQPSALPEPAPDGYDPDTRVLQNVPAWIKSIVANYLVLWFRVTQLQPRVPKEISYRAIIDALRREVYSEVYGKYMRPRMGCVFADAV